MNVILRGVRVVDPGAGRDEFPCDAWVDEGRIAAIAKRIERDGVRVIDLTPVPGRTPCVLCPAFIDLHAHLREPGDEDAETVRSGARAAAAGGFAHVVAMANTRPAVDTPDRVAAAVQRAQGACVSVHQVAALSRGLEGDTVADIEGCLAAGAIAISDDGRNAAPDALLSEALRRAGALARPVLLHPEDEGRIAALNGGRGAVALAAHRPPDAEASAVHAALNALRDAGTGQLHLQHLTTAASVALLREAREKGLRVTAEVTPHHLATFPELQGDATLRKVNPPLRRDDDVAAVRQALLDGVIDAVATDHAPHVAGRKALAYDDASPGMVGLETALAACLTFAGMSGSRLPVLMERMTLGPWRVLSSTGAVPRPGLDESGAASCVLFDPEQQWTVDAATMASRSHNTPLLGQTLHGKVLLTLHAGRVVHAALPDLQPAVAHV